MRCRVQNPVSVKPAGTAGPRFAAGANLTALPAPATTGQCSTVQSVMKPENGAETMTTDTHTDDAPLPIEIDGEAARQTLRRRGRQQTPHSSDDSKVGTEV